MTACPCRRPRGRGRNNGLRLFAGALILSPVSAYAQATLNEDLSQPKGDEPPNSPSVKPATGPRDALFRDWFGLKTDLAEKGVVVNANYTLQPATNLRGGDREIVRAAGQLAAAADIDFDKLADIEGGAGRITFTLRQGRDLTSDANLGAVQQVVEIWGRGNILRITDAWYSQQLGRFNLKVGRMMVGQDFASFSCDFLNLTLCGGQPGNIAGGYWINWPVSQWGSRLQVELSRNLSLKLGAYAVDMANVEHGLELRAPWHAQSTLLPAELHWQDRSVKTGLKTSVRLGGWYNTDRVPSLDIGSDPLDLRRGRYGGFVAVEREVLRPAGADGERHLDLFTRVSVADRRTSAIRGQATVGGIYYGWSAARPKDWIGLALGLNRINRPVVDTIADPRPKRFEKLLETFYNFQASGWLAFRPDLQYIWNPGGRPNGNDAVVAGMKINIAL